jgi:hypothetical protein
LEELDLLSGFTTFIFMASGRHLISLLMVLAGLLTGPLGLRSQDIPGIDHVVDTIDATIDIFGEEDPMEVTLILDLKKYKREKHKGEYIPATFYYHLSDSVIVEKTTRLKARGNFRREHCSFAPFWLNIRNARVADVQLQDITRIKVVTHCKGSKGYADYLLKEYLAYKIYNLLSPVSFRVRLVRMRYVDTGSNYKVTENWAFMIEPEELLAARLGGRVIKRDDLYMRLMVPEDMDRMAMFMYMIGNPDYQVYGRHNVKILGLEDFGIRGYTPVPYDFDYSGLVDTYYALPAEELGIKSVTERYYLGACRDDQDYQKAISHLADHREEILELVQEFPHIDSRVKKMMIGYLESYFTEAKGRYFFRYQLNTTCR